MDNISLFKEDYELMSLANEMAHTELSEYGKKNYPKPKRIYTASSMDIYSCKSNPNATNKLTEFGKKVVAKLSKSKKDGSKEN